MENLNWKVLREARPTAEEVLVLCSAGLAPIDVKKIAALTGVEVAFVSINQLVDILPVDLIEERLPEVEEGLVDGVVAFDKDKAVIYLKNNPKVAARRQRFTIATLLYYVFFQPAGTYARMQDGLSTAQELDALQFASELLLPASLLVKELKQNPGLTDSEFAKIFNVSQAAVEMRFKQLFKQLEELEDPAKKPWLVLDISPDLSYQEAEKIINERLEQHKPELFASLLPEYSERAAQNRQFLRNGLARLHLQCVFRLPGGVPETPDVPTIEDVKSVLKEARRLIATRGWSPRFRATDGYGKKQVRFDHANAGRFNPTGAIYRSAGDRHGACEMALAVFAKLADVPPHDREVDLWNSRTDMTVSRVLATFDQAILLAECLEQKRT